MHRSFIRRLVILGGFFGLALAVVVPVSSATRTPGSDCQPVAGGGAICRSFEVEVEGPLDTGIACESAAGDFDIFDHFVDNQTRTEWIDANGNLTNRSDHDVYSFGEWSNPLTGDVVPYTQHSVENDDFPVPGDFSTATMTFTGENIYRLATGTGKFVLQGVGRQVFRFGDFDQLLSSHGPNAFVDAFNYGDPHAFDQVCAALGAT
jgi:hypothetical protein